jgi:hypothetical protein
MAENRGHRDQYGSSQDDTFKRHGPEPPENDSGPTPSLEETRREQAQEHPAPRGSDHDEVK